MLLDGIVAMILSNVFLIRSHSALQLKNKIAIAHTCWCSYLVYLFVKCVLTVFAACLLCNVPQFLVTA